VCAASVLMLLPIVSIRAQHESSRHRNPVHAMANSQVVNFSGLSLDVSAAWSRDGTMSCGAPTSMEVALVLPSALTSPAPACLSKPSHPEFVVLTRSAFAGSYGIDISSATQSRSLDGHDVLTGILPDGYVVIVPDIDVALTIQSEAPERLQAVRDSIRINS
jgi:hypothetical protein